MTADKEKGCSRDAEPGSLPDLGHSSISLRPFLLGDQDVPGFPPPPREQPRRRRFAPVPVQMTPASSWWPQLWIPQPRL